MNLEKAQFVHEIHEIHEKSQRHASLMEAGGFIGRFSLHVLPKGFKRIRREGLQGVDPEGVFMLEGQIMRRRFAHFLAVQSLRFTIWPVDFPSRDLTIPIINRLSPQFSPTRFIRRQLAGWFLQAWAGLRINAIR